MADESGTHSLKQALEDAYLAHKRRHGLREATAWLQQRLVEAHEEQLRLDAAGGDHDNWKRIGDVARARVAEIIPMERKAAE